jgi:glutaryl-CoA dehydrogenase
MNAPDRPATKPAFKWDDPFLLDAQLADDERMVRDTAHAYAQEKLAPRIREAFRHEIVDASVFPEMGALGLLGATIPRATAAPASTTCATGSSRARSSASTRATAR